VVDRVARTQVDLQPLRVAERAGPPGRRVAVVAALAGVPAFSVDDAVVSLPERCWCRSAAGWWAAASCCPGLCVHRYPVDVELAAGHRGGVGSATERVREAAAHRQVEDDEERVVDRVGPGGRVDLGGVDGEVQVAVQVPADLLGRHRPVDLHRVGVVSRLATRAGPLAAAMPVDSLHGPPGLTPQCSVPKTELRALMSSRMSTSPLFGQVTPCRSGAPSIQNAGQ